jgi:anti-sigma B factor antagonist
LSNERCQFVQIIDEPPQHESSTFAVDLHPERETVRVAPRGELDLGTVEMLGAQLRELRDSGFEYVVLDLRKLTFMDSTGIALILAEDRAARSNGHDFSLIGGPPAIQRVLDACGVAERLRFRAR